MIQLDYQHARLSELPNEEAWLKRASACHKTEKVDPVKPGQMPSQWQQAMAKRKANFGKLKVTA